MLDKIKKINTKFNSIVFKLPFLLISGMLLTLFLTAQITYTRFKNEVLKDYSELGIGVTALMAKAYPVDKTQEFLEEGYNSPAYRETIDKLYDLQENCPNVKYMYVWICEPDSAIVVMDTADHRTLSPSPGEVDPIGSRYPYDKNIMERIDDVTTGKSGPIIFPIAVENGEELLTCISPVFDKNGKYICSVGVDFAIQGIKNANRDFILYVMKFSIFVMSFIWAFNIYIIRKDIIKPIKSMVDVINNFEYEDETHRYKNLARYADLDIKTNNELQTLYESALLIGKENLFNMSRMEHIRKEAKNYEEDLLHDELTETFSLKAYNKKIEELTIAINKNKSPKFAILMIDINNLKKINDKYGHKIGDQYIKGCIDIISNEMKQSAVYRIGGDEFVVILESIDYINRNHIIKNLTSIFTKIYNNNSLPDNERYSASLGLATFDKSKDIDFKSVFERADKRMYNNKEQFKIENGSYR